MPSLSSPIEEPMNLLSITCSKEVLRVLAGALEESPKYHFFSASSWKEARKLFSEKRIDLILLETTGDPEEKRKINALLKRGTSTRDVPAVVIARPEKSASFQNLEIETGAFDVILKPVDSITVLRKLTLYHKLFSAEQGVAALKETLKNTVEELNEKRIYLDNILQSTEQLALVAIDLDFKIRYCNQESERLFGYSATQEIGKDIFSVIEKENVSDQDFQNVLQTLIREGEFRLFYSREIKDFKIVIDTRISFIKDQAGNKVGYLVVGHDVTDVKQQEVELDEKACKLAQSNRELEQFAYIASHDLREPLRTVSGFTRILEESCKEKKDKNILECLGHIKTGVEHMSEMVNALLSYSRVGAPDTRFETVDCNQILDNVLVTLRAVVREQQAEVTSGSLPALSADKMGIFQVFQNLIENSLKFCRHQPPKIHIKAKEEEDMWLFSFRDNGIGIKSQFSDRIFKIFQRLNTRDQYPGTGIGLAICKKIVENHSGKIWVESELNEGSTFYFLLPKRAGIRSF